MSLPLSPLLLLGCRPLGLAALELGKLLRHLGDARVLFRERTFGLEISFLRSGEPTLFTE